MAVSTDQIKHYFKIRDSFKLQRVIGLADRIAGLASSLLQADFIALMYNREDSSDFVPVSFNVNTTTQIDQLNLLEYQWRGVQQNDFTSSNDESGSVGCESRPVEKTDIFADKNGFQYILEIPCLAGGVCRCIIIAYWHREQKSIKANLNEALEILSTMLTEIMLMAEGFQLVDNYSIRLSELINVLEIPIGEYHFRELVSEIIKRSRSAIPVAGIALYVHDSRSGKFELQERISLDESDQSFYELINRRLGELFGGEHQQPQITGQWQDLSEKIETDGRSIGAVQFFPDNQYHYVLVAWTEPGASFTSNDLELLSLFSLFAQVLLKNGLILRRARKAQRMLQKNSEHMVDMETTAALADMTSGLAHEFNNILGGIVGRLQLVKTKYDEPALLNLLEQLESLAMEGALTVKRIQEYTTGVKYKNFKPVDLVEIVLNTLKSPDSNWAELAEQKQINLQYTLPEDKVVFPAYRADLCSMLEKLIENAVEFSPEHSQVDVIVESTPGAIKLVVADNGPGINQENRNRVFYPFYTTKHTRGSGLSLAVVHGIVSRHGGSIVIVDNEPRGSRFEITFERGSQLSEDSDIGRRVQSRDCLSILIVDDDYQIREVLRDMLTTYGHTPSICTDAYDALQIMEQTEYDLMITDLGMPGMSGLDLAKAVHAKHPSMPIIMITGWGTQLDTNQVKANGVKRVLSKPFHLKEIRSLIAELS